MPRTVTLVVCSPGGRALGALPPLEVDSPWWPDVEPVVAAARERHGVELTVLRLLTAEGLAGMGGKGGEGSYLAEVIGTPDTLALAGDDPLRLLAERDDPLRMPWARPGGVVADAAWPATA